MYDTKQRIKSGLKRFIKVAIPLIPILASLLDKLSPEWAAVLGSSLAILVALEKALQKEK